MVRGKAVGGVFAALLSALSAVSVVSEGAKASRTSKRDLNCSVSLLRLSASPADARTPGQAPFVRHLGWRNGSIDPLRAPAAGCSIALAGWLAGWLVLTVDGPSVCCPISKGITQNKCSGQ